MSISIVDIPNNIKRLFEEIKKSTYLSRSPLSEEEQSLSPTFEKEASSTEVVEEIPESFKPIEVREQKEAINFFGFIDGVQRTILLCYSPLPNGCPVPIHTSHIAVGVILRDESGQLFVDPELLASRLLLIGPFELLKRYKKEFEMLSDPNILWDNDDRTLGLPEYVNEWVICDTSYRTTLKARDEQTGTILSEEDLFNQKLLRNRARWRAATLRHRLEFALLAKCRQKYPEKWLIMDGPLFFPESWGNRDNRETLILSQILQVEPGQVEDILLKNVVGIIKRHRFRPPSAVLQQIFKLEKETQRSAVLRIREEVDRKEQFDDPEIKEQYGGGHLTWYIRLGFLPYGQPQGFYGLARVDVHRATLELKHIDGLDPESFKAIRPQIDRLTISIIRERLPAVGLSRGAFQSIPLLYPICQLEKVLKSCLYPKRFLSYLLRGW
jgi:hypothetical protein